MPQAIFFKQREKRRRQIDSGAPDYFDFLSFDVQLQQFNIFSYLPVGLQIVLYNFSHISIKKQTLMSEITGAPLLQMSTKQQNSLDMDILMSILVLRMSSNHFF